MGGLMEPTSVPSSPLSMPPDLDDNVEQRRERLLAYVQHALEGSAAARQTPRGFLRLEVLFSIPRQARELYPYAHVDALDASKTARSYSVEAYVEQVFMTASYAEDSGDDAEPPRHRLIYALECFLYTLPRQRAAVLYVSKLDSSGWGPRMPGKHLMPFLATDVHASTSQSSSAPLESSTSITRVITEAFIRHFTSLNHWAVDTRLARVEHLSLHILARAQGAYLFPSSNENRRKHILTDGQLIKWWRSVVMSVVAAADADADGNMDVRPYYMIPGYDRLEAHQLVPLLSDKSRWVYGHPYSRKGALLDDEASLPPLPLAGPTFGGLVAATTTALPLLRPDQIATLLPHFPDDPKSRFIAELAPNAHERPAGAPPAKRLATGARATPPPPPPPSAPTPSSPWDMRKSTLERRSTTPSTPPPARRPNVGRGNSANGSRSRSGTSSPSPVKLTASQRASMRERHALDQVSADEFWARMAFRQECCSGNAVGVFVALFTRRSKEVGSDSTMVGEVNAAIKATVAAAATTGRSMPGQPLALPHNILHDVIFKRLQIDACDWSSAEQSVDLTRAWEQAVGSAIQRKGNVKQTLGDVRGEAELHADARRVGESVVWCTVQLRGPTQTQVAAAETKWREQSGGDDRVATNGAPVPAIVNVLSVKRKKKV